MNMKEVWSPVCIREIHQFTLDFENWFWEGQFVNVVTKHKSLRGVKIAHVTNGNTVQFVKDEQVIVCKYEDIIGIDYIKKISPDEGIINNNNDGWFAVKSVSSFSFDLINWFAAGQTVTLETKERIYQREVIKNIIETRNVDNDIYVVFEAEDGIKHKVSSNDIKRICHIEKQMQTS